MHDRRTGKPEDPGGLGLTLLREVLRSRTRLGGYFHAALSTPRGVPQRGPDEGPADAFPCPLPYGGGTAARPPRSPRRRGRWEAELRVRTWTNLVLGVASWCSLGQPHGCPERFRAGAPRTATQDSVVARVRGLVASWCRPLVDEGGGEKLAQVIEELLVDGDGAVADGVPERGAHRELVADRIKFDVQESTFDATPYLDTFVAGTLLEPRLLEHGGPARRLPRAVQRRREEARRLALRWDARGR